MKWVLSTPLMGGGRQRPAGRVRPGWTWRERDHLSSDRAKAPTGARARVLVPTHNRAGPKYLSKEPMP